MRVIGTAGHVDHGKSTLVRRLTGIDPDRLAEEKAREMTIDLGFAWLELPHSGTIGIVDVPGHRDFIENMLAGVGGIDAVLLVIAADEGVMPQTREHLAILDLLGVENGIVVITKTDMVSDPDWLELVEADVLSVLDGTALEHAEILRVSAHSGAGVPDLIEHLDTLLIGLPQRPDYDQPRLPIDRVFSMSGFGTVVTGTLLGGALHLGDEIEIQPTGLRGRVRSLQSYKQAVSVSYPGSRTAVNISGVDKRAIQRGHVLTHPGLLQPTRLVDVHFRHLPDAERPLQHNTEVKIYCGAAETLARARLLDQEILHPGESGWLQLRLQDALPLARGDRYIMRIPSPAQTIGGGVIVDPHPRRRWRRFQPAVISALETLIKGTPAQRLAQQAESAEPLRAAELLKRTGMAATEFDEAVRQALAEGLLTALPDDTLMATTSYRALQRQILTILEQFHQDSPLRAGMPREELRSRLEVKNATVNLLLESLEGQVVVEANIVRLPEHSVRFSEQQQAAVDRLRQHIAAQPYTPPSYTEAVEITGERVLRALIEQGEFVQVQRDIILTRPVYDEMVSETLAIIDRDGNIDAKGLRDRFNTTRKYAIGLLEHLDTLGITRRVGDERVRGKRSPAQSGGTP
jgi:selenocysteine-specific elongation factor